MLKEETKTNKADFKGFEKRKSPVEHLYLYEKNPSTGWCNKPDTENRIFMAFKCAAGNLDCNICKYVAMGRLQYDYFLCGTTISRQDYAGSC